MHMYDKKKKVERKTNEGYSSTGAFAAQNWVMHTTNWHLYQSFNIGYEMSLLQTTRIESVYAVKMYR